MPDVDKLARGVCDAMSGIVYDDDKRVTDLYAAKRYGTPGCAVTVTELLETVRPRR